MCISAGKKLEAVADINASNSQKFDPLDLPAELDGANMAFKAVLNGYGDQFATQRNRLIEYLQANYSMFKPEQVSRIATVANPDISPGRKKKLKKNRPCIAKPMSRFGHRVSSLRPVKAVVKKTSYSVMHNLDCFCSSLQPLCRWPSCIH